MNISFSGIFFLSAFLSFSTCHAVENTGFPDDESQNINDSPRGGFSGIRQLIESRNVPYELRIQPSSEEENPHRKLSAASTTPSSLKFSFPALTAFLKRGDTIMILEDSDSQRKMLAMRLKRLGFNVIEATYGYQAYDAAVSAAIDGKKISLFLFDFNVPFKADELDARIFCGQPRLNGGQTARLIKEIMSDGKNSFANSVFVCLTSTPKDAEGYEDIFWQIRDKLVEPNAEDFFKDVRSQLMISKIASIVVPDVLARGLKRGTKKALSLLSTEPNTPGIEDAEN
jgi:CheY-like chemotaxis protein